MLQQLQDGTNTIVLNEVLSITAQEYPGPWPLNALSWILNEVLSITAQECLIGAALIQPALCSSMKS